MNGRPVFVFARTSLCLAESLSEAHAEEDLQDAWTGAMNVGAPIIGLIDPAAPASRTGSPRSAGYAEVFERNVLASGVVPQISMIMGPCAGGAVYSPAMTDFIFMVKDTMHTCS